MFKKHILFFILVSVFAQNCYTDSDDDQINFLVFADMHVDSNENTPPMEINPDKVYSGNPRKNDADIKTFTSMLDAIKKDSYFEKNPPEFILILGDLASHNRPKENKQAGVKNIHRDIMTVYKLLYDKFSNIPMFYVFGNNDSLEKVDGKFHDKDVGGNVHSPFEIATQENTGWANGFLSTGELCNESEPKYPCLITQEAEQGYYSAYIKPNLRLVALNSMMFSSKPSNEIPKELAKKQLDWFESQVKAAKEHKNSLIIASHIPFGKMTTEGKKENAYFYLKEPYSKEINAIIEKYQENIVIILSGHTHRDELKIFSKFNKQLTQEMLVVAPGMSTAEGNSPGIKQFFLLRKNGEPWILANYEALSFKKSSTELDAYSLNKLYDFVNYYCEISQKFVTNNIGECIQKYVYNTPYLYRYPYPSTNCLSEISGDVNECGTIDINAISSKIKENYTMGNPNFSVNTIKYPYSVVIELEKTTSKPIKGNVFNLLMEKRFLRMAINNGNSTFAGKSI